MFEIRLDPTGTEATQYRFPILPWTKLVCAVTRWDSVTAALVFCHCTSLKGHEIRRLKCHEVATATRDTISPYLAASILSCDAINLIVQSAVLNRTSFSNGSFLGNASSY